MANKLNVFQRITSRIKIASLIIINLILYNSCSREEFNFSQNDFDLRCGKLVQVAGSSISFSDLSIMSIVEIAEIDASGDFQILATKADKFQQLLVTSKITDNVIYIGLYNPETKKIIVNDTSTVLSFLLYNPHLFNSSQDQRLSYIRKVQQSSKFPEMLSLFKQGIQKDAEKIFDLESNPLFYQLAVEIMKETIESLEKGTQKSPNYLMAGGVPSIIDEKGENIAFINPRHIFYGAGIFPDNSPLKDVVTVERQSKIISFNWDLKNVIDINEPAKTNYALGDGQFRIFLAKGLDFSKILEWNDPVGRATICNTAQTILSIFDLLIGYMPNPPIIKLPNYFHISSTRVYELSRDVMTKNVFGLVSHFAKTIVENSESIALWIWEGAIDNAGREAARKTTEKMVGILSNVSTVFKIISFVNGPGPLFYDLIFAPSEFNYYITQKNGSIISNAENFQPEAKFKIFPTSGIVGTKFKFDASESIDDINNLSQLKFRWDFESDGTWDTEWTSSYKVEHTYSSSSSFFVTLAVQDQNGLIGTTNHSINVGGGAGTASHIKLFLDTDPWGSDAMVRMLKGYGFIEGTGNKTFEILNSSEMGSVLLTPGKDLVIISNDQPQSFYNKYASNQIRFTSFVNNGGSLFWEACDNGWNKGFIELANITLPGNVKTNLKIDEINLLPSPELPLVFGLPARMDHNYASHEYFSNLPDGTTVYCVDSDNEPTLIEFNFGFGWVLMSGQPLEHQFDRIYGAPDMEKLLPAIVSYFTGVKNKKSILPISTMLGPSRPSHLF